jgi:hypothetical protein
MCVYACTPVDADCAMDVVVYHLTKHATDGYLLLQCELSGYVYLPVHVCRHNAPVNTFNVDGVLKAIGAHNASSQWTRVLVRDTVDNVHYVVLLTDVDNAVRSAHTYLVHRLHM